MSGPRDPSFPFVFLDLASFPLRFSALFVRRSPLFLLLRHSLAHPRTGTKISVSLYRKYRSLCGLLKDHAKRHTPNSEYYLRANSIRSFPGTPGATPNGVGGNAMARIALAISSCLNLITSGIKVLLRTVFEIQVQKFCSVTELPRNIKNFETASTFSNDASFANPAPCSLRIWIFSPIAIFEGYSKHSRRKGQTPFFKGKAGRFSSLQTFLYNPPHKLKFLFIRVENRQEGFPGQAVNALRAGTKKQYRASVARCGFQWIPDVVTWVEACPLSQHVYTYDIGSSAVPLIPSLFLKRSIDRARNRFRMTAPRQIIQDSSIPLSLQYSRHVSGALLLDKRVKGDFLRLCKW